MNQITIIIPAKDEAENIRYALESCAWAQKIFVIDNFSTDATPTIVAEFSNAELISRPFDGYAKQKNWALVNLPIQTEWILFLDADEVVSPPLAEEMCAIAQKPSAPDCWYVNRRFIFLGRWIKHAGWYPSWNLRFFRRGKAFYEEREIDEHMIASSACAYLRNDLIHENHKGVHDWIAKHNTYSTLQAQELFSDEAKGLRGNMLSRHPVERKRAIKRLFHRLPFRPLLRFLVMYILQLGFLEAKAGFSFLFEYHHNLYWSQYICPNS